MKRLLITCPHMLRTIDAHRKALLDAGIEADCPEVVQQLSERELVERIGAYDAAIAGDDPYSRAVFAAATRLKILVKWGIGVDAIDFDAAEEFGIPVKNTPDMFGDEVADVVIGYLVMLTRHLHRLDRSVRDGRWDKFPGVSLAGRTMGVIGVGSIGRAVVRRARAMRMTVVGSDVAPISAAFIEETGLRALSLEPLLAQSDVIAICCNLTLANHHLLDQRAFAGMKQGVFIINTSRGPVIDERALASALESGRVAGAALDVFEIEPLPEASPLRRFSNCIFGTHNASNTDDAVERVNRLAVEMVIEALR